MLMPLPRISDIEVTFRCSYPGGSSIVQRFVIKNKSLKEQLKNEIIKWAAYPVKVIIQGEKEDEYECDQIESKPE